MLRRLIYRIKWLCVLIRNKKVLIGRKSEIAISTSIMAYCNGKVAIGDNFIVRGNTSISASNDGQIEIGDDVFINRNCVICARKRIRIEKGCIIGPNVCIYDHNHLFDFKCIEKNEFKVGEVFIDEGAWIGAGVIILKGVRIGTGAIVGAGCIVKEDIPPHSILTISTKNYIIKKIENRI